MTEEELLDMLVKILEAEQIKRRRRPIPEPEPAPDKGPDRQLLAIVREIIQRDVPPADMKERRECMLLLANYLKLPSDDSQSIQTP